MVRKQHELPQLFAGVYPFEHLLAGQHEISASRIVESGLTGKQEAAIRAILQAETPNIELLSSQLTKNSRQLQIAARGELPDNVLQPLLSQRAQLEAELGMAKERLKMKIYEVLIANSRVPD